MRGRRVFLVRRLAALVALLAVAFVIWFMWSLFQPFAGSGRGSVSVTIPRGASVGQIGSLLEREGVISSGFFFGLRAALDGDRSKLRAGYYQLREGMSYGSALRLLTTESGLPPTARVTIVPGKARTQVQAELHADGIRGNYVRSTLSSPLLDPRQYGAPAGTPSLEGFLWPDTYELRRPVKLETLIDDQLENFKQQISKVDFSYAQSQHLTPYQVLIVASLISQEAMRPGDERKVASVIYNRLRAGMNLGLDSTVEYATGHYGDITEKDLQSTSPYNTRNHPGLPPTPIDSPDMDAIQAAAHPATTPYLYFINRVCGDGALRFTASYQQFLAWSAAWSAATARAAEHGGNAEFCRNGKP